MSNNDLVKLLDDVIGWILPTVLLSEISQYLGEIFLQKHVMTVKFPDECPLNKLFSRIRTYKNEIMVSEEHSFCLSSMK